MYSKFTFRERSSEEYGVMVVSFGNSSSNDLYSGQSTKLITDKSALSPEWELISQNYEKPMEFEIQIINEDGSDITQDQERSLCQWLCKRGEYQWLFIQDERYSDIWIRCNFNNPQVWTVGNIKGMQFVATTSSSIAFSGEREYNYAFTDDDKTINDLYVYNDEEIPIYPYLEILIEESGNLKVSNNSEIDNTYTTQINNVLLNEIIIIDGENIISNIEDHDIFNDSNLKWPRLYNGNNVINFNLKCSVYIKFREYRKLVVF